MYKTQGHQKMAAKPFQLINLESIKDPNTKKSTEIKQLPTERNGFKWVEAKSNLDGDYAFKEDNFTIEAYYMTGFVDSTGHHWLLGEFKNWESLFDIKWSIAKGTKDNGKANWEDSPELEGIKKSWEEGGAYAALMVDDIPQLVLLSEFLSGKLAMEDTGYKVYPKLNPNKQLFSEISQEIFEAGDFEYAAQRRNDKHKTFTKENSWFYLFHTAEDIEICELDFKESPFQIELDDEEAIKNVKVEWSAPEIKEKRPWSGGGAKGQNEADALKERLDFAFAELLNSSRDTDYQQVQEKYGLTKLNMVMAIACGGWQPVIQAENTVLSTNSSKNGHVKSASQNEPTQEKANLEPKGNVTTTEKSSATLSTDEPLYAGKILALQQSGSHKLPKEIDSEFLKEKGNLWCKNFYELLNGTLDGRTVYGKDTRMSRAVLTYINKEFKAPLLDMTAQGLEKILNHESFEATAIQEEEDEGDRELETAY